MAAMETGLPYHIHYPKKIISIDKTFDTERGHLLTMIFKKIDKKNTNKIKKKQDNLQNQLSLSITLPLISRNYTTSRGMTVWCLWSVM